ncbi:MAG: pentapeptide repeat-containing protein [Nostoc sp.]|uniref:pentapeptide repeat-containing protein n=1 Tax=Nostoc sp. TaxID=1180 RepID=UPI002FF5A629
MKNISPTNNSQLSKICLRIYAFQEKFHPIQHQSPKQRLRIAIEQLGNKTIETSLAVINDLEQITQNHPHYHWIIMDILTTFVRENALYMTQEELTKSEVGSRKSEETRLIASVLCNGDLTPTQNLPLDSCGDLNPQNLLTSNLRPKVRADIQAALTVIARRDVNKDPENEQLDLSHTDIRGANLNRANLEQTNLYQANLAGANLREANLAGAVLSAANLEGANLYLANLEGAILSAANLEGANLEGANLHRASLYLARLHGAILNDARLDGANIREAKFSE